MDKVKSFLNSFHAETRWFVAEFLGTCLLSLMVGLLVVGINYYSSTYQYVFLPLFIGILIAVMVYILGPVSGAHFNPAVSLGLWIIRKIRGYKLVIHVVAQIAGAYAGAALVSYFIGMDPQIFFGKTSLALVAEAVGAGILMISVVSVVVGKTPEAIAGFSIGSALMIGIMLSLIGSGGILNPAVAIAYGGFKIAYIVGPLLGATVGALVSHWLYLDPPEELQEEALNRASF